MTGGSADCRTGNQWKQVGRHVTKEAAGKCGYIIQPKPIYDDKDNPDKKVKFMLYNWVSVVPYQYTDGLPVEEYEQEQLPPLMDVAQAMGINVKWTPLLDAYGKAYSSQKRINMSTSDFSVFFHELMHIADRQKHPKVKDGQEPDAETVAELGAAILMELYCEVDRSGNAWSYIKHYNPDNPIKAIMDVLKRTGDALQIILKKHLEISEAG
jgi:hypothetical protein